MEKLNVELLSKFGKITLKLNEVKRNFKGFPDIVKINYANITGDYKFITSVKLKVNLKVDTELTMLCSYTLKEVLTPLNFNLNLIFSNDDEADYPLEPIIDLDEIIIGNIVSEAPYNVYAS